MGAIRPMDLYDERREKVAHRFRQRPIALSRNRDYSKSSKSCALPYVSISDI